jgi:hypothetical protein
MNVGGKQEGGRGREENSLFIFFRQVANMVHPPTQGRVDGWTIFPKLSPLDAEPKKCQFLHDRTGDMAPSHDDDQSTDCGRADE